MYVAHGQTDGQHWVGAMLPTGHVTGYGSMAGRLLTTLTAVLTSCLLIYIFWTPYRAPGWQTICQRHQQEAGCHPLFTNTRNQFLPCQDKVLIVTTRRSGVYHYVSHMKDSQNNSIGNRLFVTLYCSNSFLIKTTVQLLNLILNYSCIQTAR